jgi:hypothetical protein
MYATSSEVSAVLRQLIYQRAEQISRQITQAAEEFGSREAEQRRQAREEKAFVAANASLYKPVC